MVKYLVIFGYFSEIVEVEEETTNYQELIDILIDRLEEEGKEGCFIRWEEAISNGFEDGKYYDDEFSEGGNHGRLLYHGGNFRIEKVEE